MQWCAMANCDLFDKKNAQERQDNCGACANYDVERGKCEKENELTD